MRAIPIKVTLWQPVLAVLLAEMLSGCGLSVAQIPEIWDQTSSFSTANMEMRVKNAIYCQLRDGVREAREIYIKRSYQGKDVTQSSDEPFPDNWGAAVELTFRVDETSSLSPSVSLLNPLSTEQVALRSGVEAVKTSFSFAIGAKLSSENIREDKFDYFYSAVELLGPTKLCSATTRLPPPSQSSPFVDGAHLGISDWLPGAVAVVQYARSSRAAPNGEGKPLKMEGKSSDSATYNNKFVIITSGNIAPSWNLVRVSTPNSPFFDLNRTRTHELLITIGEAAEPSKTGKGSTATTGLSQAASNAHLASQIGNAVSLAIRGN